MLLRLAYLGLTNTFALFRLLPMTDRDKDVEILALRHQIGVATTARRGLFQASRAEHRMEQIAQEASATYDGWQVTFTVGEEQRLQH